MTKMDQRKPQSLLSLSVGFRCMWSCKEIATVQQKRTESDSLPEYILLTQYGFHSDQGWNTLNTPRKGGVTVKEMFLAG